METNFKETLSTVADATLAQPITMEVDVIPQGWLHKLLQKWGVRDKKRVFTLRPITLGNLMRISRILLEIDIKKILDSGVNFLEGSYQAMDQHSEKLAEVVAISITNRKDKPSRRLIEFICNNFTSTELVGVISIVIKQMNVSGFMTSIISIRGLTILEPAGEVNPEEQGSRIAPGILSAAS